MKQRLLFLLRLYITLILIFVTQKIVFMLINIAHAEGAPFSQCCLSLFHGLKLDSVAACYILIIPLLVLIISGFFKSFPLKKVLLPYYIIAGILMALIFAADAILYFFWGSKLDAVDLMFVSKPKEIFINLEWWVTILAVSALGLLSWHYIRRLLHPTKETLDAIHSKWLSLIFIPVAGLLFLGMRASVTESTANPSYAYFSKYAFCNHAALNPFFNMAHSLFKAQDLEHEFEFMSYEEAENIVNPLFSTDMAVSDSLLSCQRPDILLIIWESGGKSMTMYDSVAPNLMRYCREGVYFSNCYANNFRTDRGIVSIISGWMGLPTTSLIKMSDRCCKLPGLPHELAKQGYDSKFSYGGDIDFANMRGYLHETGFASVGGSSQYPKSQNESSWGVPDAYTLRPSALGFGSDFQHNSDNPLFSAILTLSSHEPWDVPYHHLSDIRLNSFAYTDSCIGALVDSLRASPAWDSLLVIIVPDHGIPSSTAQTTTDPAVPPIPMVWIGGAVRKPTTVPTMMMQSDLAATLFAQLGFPFKAFPFSRNILDPSFASRYQFAVHAYKNGCNVFDPNGLSRFDCADKSMSTLKGEPNPQRDSIFKAMIQYIYQKTARL